MGFLWAAVVYNVSYQSKDFEGKDLYGGLIFCFLSKYRQFSGEQGC